LGKASRLKKERQLRALQSPKAHETVVKELSKGNTDTQIGKLIELNGINPKFQSAIKDSILKNAPKEMDKAIAKYKKINKPITIESLTKEVRENKQFLALCNKNGITIEYFENLAKNRMEANNL
jgi:hypothetical protein